ncbi:DUF3761 domain-containing protein [Streptomyces bungoensis]
MAIAVASVFFSAPAASAATLPSTNTAHPCVQHTTGVCGWTHNKKPANKYETAKCKDTSLSYSRHSQGTCSRHHGLRHWFKRGLLRGLPPRLGSGVFLVVRPTARPARGPAGCSGGVPPPKVVAH